MRSHMTTASDVLAGRRSAPEADRTARLQRGLNRELRAEVDGLRRAD